VGLSENLPYKVRVNAANSVGVSAWVQLSAPTLSSSATKPDAPPTGPAMVANLQETVELSWSSSVNLNGLALLAYQVEYQIGSGAWTLGYTGLATSAVVSGLTPATAYNWRYMAKTSAGLGYPSPMTAIATIAWPGCPSANALPCSGNGSCDKSVCQCGDE
jgi:hypothetical protein